MTRDEILNMPAGRDIDALIAEKVMGWARDNSDEGDYFDFWSTDPKDTENTKVQLLTYKFSEVITLAWGLVEKLGLVVGIDANPEVPDSPWCASIDWENHRQSTFTAWAPSAPLAICRVVLLLVTSEDRG